MKYRCDKSLRKIGSHVEPTFRKIKKVRPSSKEIVENSRSRTGVLDVYRRTSESYKSSLELLKHAFK
jgi:16S rRNA C1402 N4-methylase RsmH